MDKAQKQLVDTYFRKRKIASDIDYDDGGDEGSPYSFRNYEIRYTVINSNMTLNANMLETLFGGNDKEHENDEDLYNPYPYYQKNKRFVNLNKVDDSGLVFLLQHWFKDYISMITPEKLNSLPGKDIALIISYNPNAVKNFDLNKLNSADIPIVLSRQYGLGNYFDLNRMDTKDAVSLFSKRPYLIKNYDTTRFSGEETRQLASKEYNLIPFLDMNKIEPHSLVFHKFGEYEDSKIMGFLIGEHPELIDKFDLSKIGRTGIHEIIDKQPQFAKLFDLNKLESRDIWITLRNHPELYSLYKERDILKNLNDKDKGVLIHQSPGFKDKLM